MFKMYCHCVVWSGIVNYYVFVSIYLAFLYNILSLIYFVCRIFLPTMITLIVCFYIYLLHLYLKLLNCVITFF